jgi:2-pyrone-4,6-dicarboxylate lactonase
MYCDAHVHIVGPEERYPQVPTRMFRAGMADPETLSGVAAPHGVTRFVIVQPSFYGTDNTAERIMRVNPARLYGFPA